MENWILADYRMQGMQTSSFEFHSHHEYEIYFFHAGECKYLINNRIYDLQPGDILLMDGLILHKPNPRLESLYTRSVVHFSPTFVVELLEVLGVPNLLDPFKKLNNWLLRTGYDESARVVDEKIERIANLVVQCNKERQHSIQKDELLEAEIKIQLIQLLIEIYHMSQKELAQVTSKSTEKEKHAESIASWINENYKEKINLDRIAGELNLSKYYASHVFKEITGFTVMEYVMGCRLNQAKFLLEMEPNHSLAEVARQSGFESISHFSRFFKEKVGITPTQYRKNITNTTYQEKRRNSRP
ncbi:hypothetical protein BIV60_27120 [Bacillus sp. MUM 116]|uniref:AraC family transcriptional regulator n=1 Tax=Bacillus sp. MUM 116 TaxID=1678002 RepID=UPI0008F5CC98|nr:AraC family transcriptional regulator [Bacillus sp. MUM 116]OIK07161.1 hypothetical protein BIV60_27120 [Bacillus sp. MUM 116]